MEWVETTGRSVEEAKEAALDELGVDEQDAEFEVLEEAKSGLFGRLRSEARVRARIRPTRPRPKVDRRDRRRRGGERDQTTETTEGEAGAAVPRAGGPDVADDPDADADTDRTGGRGRDRAAGGQRRNRSSAGRSGRTGPARAGTDTPEETVEQRSVETQQAALQTYFEGLLDAFGLTGTVSVVAVDEDTLEARLDGDDLGLLIGPKGTTLNALQDLVRSSVQRPGDLRFRVDVSGYRQRRRDALERFTRSIAEKVLETGVPTSLEPMNAADRKVVHDTVNTIDGVRTTSQGEDPYRFVIVAPDA